MKTRILLLLPVLAFTAMHAYAQTNQYSIANILHQDKFASFARNAHSAAKTTNSGESRLIGYCILENNGATFVPDDSLSLSYSGNMGGDLSHTLKYDTGYTYGYSTATSTYINANFITQTFDANNNISASFSKAWDVTTNTYVNNGQSMFTYDGNNNMLTEIAQSWSTTSNTWVNAYKYIYTYDGNNNNLTEIGQAWDATNSVWVNSYQYIFTYTAANKVSNEIYQNWNTSAWLNISQYLYTFDASNNELTDVYQEWDATSSEWVNSSMDTYTYDASNDPLTDLYQNWNSGTWVNNSLATESNFIAQMPQMVINQNWDATNNVWDNYSKDLASYNSYNQLTNESTQQWNLGGFWQATTNNELINLYYQTYDLSVKSISNTGGTAHIYPVPAEDILHIDLAWDAPQACNIAIYDVQGRVLKQWQVPATTAYHNTIPVNDLAEGNYFINITGVNGQIVQKLVVSK